MRSRVASMTCWCLGAVGILQALRWSKAKIEERRKIRNETFVAYRRKRPGIGNSDHLRRD